MAEHIHVPDVVPRVQYIATGALTSFIYPFPIFAEPDLEVYLDDALQSDGYSVAGVGASQGGTVTFDVAPSANTTLTLRRRLSISRQTDFQEAGEFRAKVINDELDYLVAALQQLADDLNRSITLSPTDGDATIVLPDKTTRARKAVIFDENGNLVASQDDFDQLSASASIARTSADEAAISAANAANSETSSASSANVAASSAAASSASADNAAGSAAAAQAAPVSHGTHLYLLSQGFGSSPGTL